jgi:hypothetical protein
MNPTMVRHSLFLNKNFIEAEVYTAKDIDVPLTQQASKQSLK